MEWKQSVSSWKFEISWGADSTLIGTLIYTLLIADLDQDPFSDWLMTLAGTD